MSLHTGLISGRVESLHLFSPEEFNGALKARRILDGFQCVVALVKGRCAWEASLRAEVPKPTCTRA